MAAKHSQKHNEQATVKLDLNNPIFQRGLFSLGKQEQTQALNTLKKILQMTWPQVYADHGLNWEKIVSVPVPAGINTDALYSIRINEKCRALAYRDGTFMRFLIIEPDHDKAYGKK